MGIKSDIEGGPVRPRVHNTPRGYSCEDAVPTMYIVNDYAVAQLQPREDPFFDQAEV